MVFCHQRNIVEVQPFLSQADTERLMHAFITSRLDYCNAVLSGLPKKVINKLGKELLLVERVRSKVALVVKCKTQIEHLV